MNKLVLIFAVTAVLLGNECAGVYVPQGDHFGESGDVEDSPAGVSQFIVQMAKELEELISRRSPEEMTAKFSDDAVYVRQGRTIAEGKEAILQLYKDWYDSGVYGASVKVLRAEMLGHEYMSVLLTYIPYNEERITIGEETGMGILRRVEDGFQIFMKTEIVSHFYYQKCPA